MGISLYTIAITIIAWSIGLAAYHSGEIIYVLLIIAVVAVLLRLIRSRRI